MRGGHETIVLPPLIEYSCSVIIASNPGFLFQNFSRSFREKSECKARA